MGIGLFLPLLLDKPIQKLHRAEVPYIISRRIDIVDQGGNILLVLQTCLQNLHMAGKDFIRLGNGIQGDGLILILQIFIGSSSAKIMLVMPIIVPICASIGISPAMVILAYCMADGFTDVILPTNPVLLIGLSMANVSYGKWLKWSWKLQLLLLVISVLVLLFGVLIGY